MSWPENLYSPMENGRFRAGLGITALSRNLRHMAAFSGIWRDSAFFGKSLFQNGDLRKREKIQAERAFKFAGPEIDGFKAREQIPFFIPGNSCKRLVTHRAVWRYRVRSLGIII